ncbi:Haloacid dehalogenase-like hydrolase [Nostoc sp. NIES-3756]|nr:Haloacid dehalogenase-like hydrolase [Nostoc sp. NIES-3756]
MKLVIFDVDGTLINSNDIDAACFIRAFELELAFSDINSSLMVALVEISYFELFFFSSLNLYISDRLIFPLLFQLLNMLLNRCFHHGHMFNCVRNRV